MSTVEYPAKHFARVVIFRQDEVENIFVSTLVSSPFVLAGRAGPRRQLAYHVIRKTIYH